jgi:hypothetical protein
MAERGPSRRERRGGDDQRKGVRRAEGKEERRGRGEDGTGEM